MDTEKKDEEQKEVEEKDSEQKDEEQKDEEQNVPEQKTVERKKIFLVDDTEFSLVRTKQFLKEFYTVYTLDSAAKMFNLLENVMPDLILLDIEMPGMNGYDTLKLLLADERYAKIPVIFLSGKYDEESILKGLNLGAVDHVTKPYTPKDLLTRIANNINLIDNETDFQIDLDKNVSKLTILAVDDSPSMLRSIHFALKNHYKVHTLQKPEKLKTLIMGLKPDLFLLDYNMPVINGFELVKEIREYPDFKETPVVFLTSESSQDHLKEAINLGINDYVVKPFNPKKLREKIAKCMVRKP